MAIHWDEAMRRLKALEATVQEHTRATFQENLENGAFVRGDASFKSLDKVKKDPQLTRAAMLVFFANHSLKNSHAWTAYQKPYFFTHKPLEELSKLKIPWVLSDLELMTAVVLSRDRVDDFRLGYALSILVAAMKQFHKLGKETDALIPMIAEIKTLIEGMEKWEVDDEDQKADFMRWAEKANAAEPTGFEMPHLLQRRICRELYETIIASGTEEPKAREFVMSLPDHEESRPTTRWRRAVETFIAGANREVVGEALAKALEQLAAEVDRWNALDWAGKYQAEVQILNTARSMGRGLFWAVGLSGLDPLVTRMVAAARPFTATDGANYFSGILFACAAGLGLNGSAAALSALQKLRMSILNRTLARQVDRVIQEVATSRGAPAGEVMESAVPAFDMEPDGTWTKTLGQYTVRIAVMSSREVVLEAAKGTAKMSRTIPAELRTAHPQELQEARDRVREISQALSGQRDRLEKHMEEGRQLDIDVFRERFVAHPLMHLISKHLVWETEDGRAFLGADPSPQGAGRVRLWHPARATEKDVEHWRSVILERKSVQPFRQVFREAYRPTAQEGKTGESTRFAAHVVQYSLFQGLRKTRGWLGEHDAAPGGAAARKVTRECSIPGVKAIIFWSPFTDEVDEQGNPRYATLDKIRFAQGQGDAPSPLGDLDVAFISESMRDVDQFVTVAAVQRDAAWSSGKGDGKKWLERMKKIEEEPLLESGLVRRALIEKLMPDLGLSKATVLEEKHLKVKGTLATYHVHLGTADITVEPSNTLLVLTSDRKPVELPQLPFEEPDPRLADVIVKARTLATDAKSKDPALKRISSK